MMPSILCVLSLLSPILASTSLPTAVTIGYAAIPTTNSIKAPSPQALAVLEYHSTNNSYSLSSYNIPSVSKSKSSTDDNHKALARIGIIPQSKSATARLIDGGFAGLTTTVTRLETLQRPEDAVLRIVLDAEGGVQSAGLGRDLESGYGDEAQARLKQKANAKTQGKGSVLPRLDVVRAIPEPRPVLNKPVVLDQNGKLPAQDKPEPTLLQRYWWVGAIVLFMMVGAGGGGGDEGGK